MVWASLILNNSIWFIVILFYIIPLKSYDILFLGMCSLPFRIRDAGYSYQIFIEDGMILVDVDRVVNIADGLVTVEAEEILHWEHRMIMDWEMDAAFGHVKLLTKHIMISPLSKNFSIPNVISKKSGIFLYISILECF